MTGLPHLVVIAQEALLLVVMVSLPVVLSAALASLIAAILQALTQVQDSTIAHLPRLLAVAIALIVAGPWMGSRIALFAARMFGAG